MTNELKGSLLQLKSGGAMKRVGKFTHKMFFLSFVRKNFR